MTTTGGSFTLRRTASAICTRQGSARTSPRVGIVVFFVLAARLTPSTVSRGNLPEHVMSETQLEPSWKALGMTASTYSWGKSVPAQLTGSSHLSRDQNTSCSRISHNAGATRRTRWCTSPTWSQS